MSKEKKKISAAINTENQNPVYENTCEFTTVCIKLKLLQYSYRA